LAKLPTSPSPADFSQIPPELRTLPAGTELWRIYKRGGRHPVLWNTFRAYGPLRTARFDHHLPDKDGLSFPQDRKILYAASEIATCLAEFFQGTRTVSREAEEPWLAGFQLRLDVVLLDLTGVWPTRAGASMAINSGPRPRSRLWSQAVYEAYPEAQGLYYASSMHANRPAAALYERARPALPFSPIFNRPLSDPALLGDLDRTAQSLNYRLI
jgi:hypothetical protein